MAHMVSVFQRAELSPNALEGYDEVNPERVFGVCEEMDIPLEVIITLSQVRPGRNPEHVNLVGSIRRSGLLSPVTLARMQYDELAGYVGFIQKVWKDNVDIDLLRPHTDGFYYVMVGGYSRKCACDELRLEPEFMHMDHIRARIYSGLSPVEVARLMIDDNISSNPPPERTAITVVESYLYGQHCGMWSTPEEYVECMHGKVRSGVLMDALEFANLPEAFRDRVQAGKLKYSLAIELGRLTPYIQLYHETKLGISHEEMDKRCRDLLDEVIGLKLNAHLMHASKGRMGIKAFKLYVAAHIEALVKANQAKEPELIELTFDELDVALGIKEDKSPFEMLREVAVAARDVFRRERWKR